MVWELLRSKAKSGKYRLQMTELCMVGDIIIGREKGLKVWSRERFDMGHSEEL